MSTFIHIISGGYDVYVQQGADNNWGTDGGAAADTLPLSPESIVYGTGAQYWYQEGILTGIDQIGSKDQLTDNAWTDTIGNIWLFGALFWDANPDVTVPVTNTSTGTKQMPWAMQYDPSTEGVLPKFWVPSPTFTFGGATTYYWGSLVSACDNLTGPGIYAVVTASGPSTTGIVYYPSTGQTANTLATDFFAFQLRTSTMETAGYPVGHGDVYDYHTLVPRSTIPALLTIDQLPYWWGEPIKIFTHNGLYWCLARGVFIFPQGSEVAPYDDWGTYPTQSSLTTDALWTASSNPHDPVSWSLVTPLSHYNLNNWYADKLTDPPKRFGEGWSLVDGGLPLYWVQSFGSRKFISKAGSLTTDDNGFATAYDMDDFTGIWVLDETNTLLPSYTQSFPVYRGLDWNVRLLGPLAVLNDTLYALEWDGPLQANGTTDVTLRLLQLTTYPDTWTLINEFTQSTNEWGTLMWGSFFAKDGFLWFSTDRSDGSEFLAANDLLPDTVPNFRIWHCDPTGISLTSAWTLWADVPWPGTAGVDQRFGPTLTRVFAN